MKSEKRLIHFVVVMTLLGIVLFPPHPLMADSLTMIHVDGGLFQMGDTFGSGFVNETPVHEVSVSNFYLSKFEVTQKEWIDVMGNNPSHFKGDNLPVENVSWFEAIFYCNAKSTKEGLKKVYSEDGIDWTANGYRLPTEAEWEYAAKGGKDSHGYQYSGSNDADQVAWSSENSGETTHPVGTKAPNELGFYDMSGNVFEWCWDRAAIYTSQSQKDPVGPVSGTKWILRGGSWDYPPKSARSTARHTNPYYGASTIGFRVCRRE
jgi:formylglycine-generating enzyme required for sulfatase activity